MITGQAASMGIYKALRKTEQLARFHDIRNKRHTETEQTSSNNG